MQNWILKRELSDQEQSVFAPYGELLGHLLFHRGIKTEEEANRFMNPNYERDLHDPFLILNMKRAVDRIIEAISKGEKIVVYGDYDCDGIPGSVVLHDFFKKINYSNFYVYIPHRHLEGYGLNLPAVEKFAQDGVKLLITVDNGITDVEEVDRANELGIDVIITDHHLPQAEVPKAYAILNSKQEEDKYPFDMLCGAGVAFKLVQALLRTGKDLWNIKEGWEKWLLDVAGISTIADMVPLHGENRVLAYYGLKVLKRTSRPGLLKLFNKARVNLADLTETDVGFTIAPRINAASRMGVPINAFNLLSTTDDVEAGMMADYLESRNNERKRVVTKMMIQVEKMMESDNGLSVIVVGDKSWPPGVVGLAASKIVEKYKRPAFVWGLEGAKEIKGSCRSDGKVNLVDLMVATGEGAFIGMGGHALAGGFSVSEESLDTLALKLSEAYLKLTTNNLDTGSPSLEKVEVDRKISIDDVNLNTCNMLAKMAPFGMGNARPTFLLENLEVSSVNYFGSKKDHLRLDFEDSFGGKVSAVMFGFRDKIDKDLSAGDKIDMLAQMEVDTYGYRPKVRLKIIDLR
ncbi:MAG: single-stranded-DNA-specific exonuclease RecJ [bacterium]|nr:single-stranded-DNA-specific exonuclease RecJ [bacterium]